MYKIYIFMQCAPDHYEFFQSIFGLRADVEIGRISSDVCTSLSTAQPNRHGRCGKEKQKEKRKKKKQIRAEKKEKNNVAYIVIQSYKESRGSVH